MEGKYSFIVATHTDRAHIHNHIVFNSTAMDGSRKFRNFYFSGLALQKISDLVCMEHNLSVIESVPYDERKKRTEFPEKTNFRDEICKKIDEILSRKPQDMNAFLEKLRTAGYEIKTGAHIAVKGKDQKTRTAENRKPVKPSAEYRTRSFNLYIDIDKRVKEKGPAYERWVKLYNLQQRSKAMVFARDHKVRNLAQLSSLAEEKVKARDELLSSIRSSEARLAEIATLKKHIINYSKTRTTYEEYRKAGYSKKFFEAHREELTLHKAAKDAFNELGVKKIPKVKDLNSEYADHMASKKQAYAEYRKARDEAQEYLIAERNLSVLYGAETQEEKERQKSEKVH